MVPQPLKKEVSEKLHPYLQVRETIDLSIEEGGVYAMVVALGETYFPAFVLASHLGNVPAGLIATLPMLVAASFQLLSPKLLKHFQSYKHWILTCTTLQGISLLPLLYFSWFGGMSLLQVFLCAVFYFTSGQLAAPVWNIWVSGLIPKRLHTGFFASRNRRMQIFSLVGFVVGGMTLHYLPQPTLASRVFTPLIVIAILCRFYSIFLLTRHPKGLEFEPLKEKKSPSLGMLIEHIKKRTTLGSLVFYLLIFQFAVNVSGPFFAPFIIDNLKFSYMQYSFLILACYLGKIVALPWAAETIRRKGPEKMLWQRGTLLAVIPLGFMFISNFYGLFLVQFTAGLFWAGFELSSILMLLGSLPKNLRSTLFTYYHFSNAVAMATASLVGGFLLRNLSSSNAYFWIFGASVILRLAAQKFIKPWDEPKLKGSASDSENLVQARINE